MKHRYFIGIDPGFNSGAIAMINTNGSPIYFINFGEDIKGKFENFSKYFKVDGGMNAIGMIEKVQARPAKDKSGRTVQGIASTFKFGRGYGRAEMFFIALGIEYRYVAPAKWQRGMDCLTRGNKKITRDLAKSMFPGVVITNANADAFLIAEYCRRTVMRELE